MFDHLTSRATSLLKAEFNLDAVEIQWRRPQESDHGDISTVVALQLGKQLGKNPQEIAAFLCDALAKEEMVEKCNVAGPGYVNIWLTPAALIVELATTREACVAKVLQKKSAPVIVEYSQPNIAKPLGVHHLIGTVLGQSVANLYRHLGYNVIAWNYIGDWGTQFGKLAVAMQLWGGSKPVREYTLDEMLDLYVRFNEEAEHDAALDEKGREAFKKLEQGDPALRAFWTDVVSVTKQSIQELYQRLHVFFDEDKGESFYSDKMQPIIDEGKRKEVFEEGKEGSLIVQFTEEENMPVYLIVKGDGATLYSTRDLAQMRYRIDTYHPQAILIFTDIAQKLHFEQLIATCEKLGWELPEFENVLFGRMSFPDRSMSTRKGNIVQLEKALDEAVRRADALIAEKESEVTGKERVELAEMLGVGAFVYGILSQNRKQNMVFTWEKALTFDGNSGPYLQYTHARAQSILRKANVTGAEQFPSFIPMVQLKERVLIGTLLQFAAVLEEACAMHMPHILANYLYQLCQDYNTFYNDLPIVHAEEPARALRIALTALTSHVLKTGAELLTLRVPNKM